MKLTGANIPQVAPQSLTTTPIEVDDTSLVEELRLKIERVKEEISGYMATIAAASRSGNKSIPGINIHKLAADGLNTPLKKARQKLAELEKELELASLHSEQLVESENLENFRPPFK